MVEDIIAFCLGSILTSLFFFFQLKSLQKEIQDLRTTIDAATPIRRMFADAKMAPTSAECDMTDEIEREAPCVCGFPIREHGIDSDAVKLAGCIGPGRRPAWLQEILDKYPKGGNGFRSERLNK